MRSIDRKQLAASAHMRPDTSRVLWAAAIAKAEELGVPPGDPMGFEPPLTFNGQSLRAWIDGLRLPVDGDDEREVAILESHLSLLADYVATVGPKLV